MHSEDFDDKYRGRLTPYDHQGEIKVDGLVRMARPKSWNDKARAENNMRAQEAVIIYLGALARRGWESR